MPEPYNKDQLDLLLHIERLTEEINRRAGAYGGWVGKRYPLTFMIVALFGVVAVSEGVKGILEDIGFLQEHPAYMLAIGLFILLILGSVYKRLNK